MLRRLFICRLIVKEVHETHKCKEVDCAIVKHWETRVKLLIRKRIKANSGLVTHVYVLEEVAHSLEKVKDDESEYPVDYKHIEFCKLALNIYLNLYEFPAQVSKGHNYINI